MLSLQAATRMSSKWRFDIGAQYTATTKFLSNDIESGGKDRNVLCAAKLNVS